MRPSCVPGDFTSGSTNGRKIIMALRMALDLDHSRSNESGER